jgi:hypothetical protein
VRWYSVVALMLESGGGVALKSKLLSWGQYPFITKIKEDNRRGRSEDGSEQHGQSLYSPRWGKHGI